MERASTRKLSCWNLHKYSVLFNRLNRHLRPMSAKPDRRDIPEFALRIDKAAHSKGVISWPDVVSSNFVALYKCFWGNFCERMQVWI